MNDLLSLLKKPVNLVIAIFLLGMLFLFLKASPAPLPEETPVAKVKKQSFSVNVRTIGELEAAHSTSISSLVRGDNGKIIYLVPDGTTVKAGEVLVKLDPTPFEEKLESLQCKLKEQESHAAALEKGLDWETGQAERDDKTAVFEVEAAELELNKVLLGDGPLEIARLKGAMQKALSKFEELSGYSNDLKALEEQGFLNPIEIKHAQKHLDEEKDAYESAKLQYESYLNHVYPMQIKKAEAAVKQAKMKREETQKIRSHAIAKAKVELNQAYQALESVKLQYQEAKRELALTEILAPAPGMVVHREDFRSGQRRKPRLSDVLIRNQIILDLPDLNFMMVKSKVREVDLCKVELGKSATVEIDAYPQLTFTGKITLIGMLALPEPGKPSEEKYFEIRILLDKSDARVRPGMTTRVLIHGHQVQDALTVPVHAIFHEDKKKYCYVANRSGFEKREVVQGVSDEEWAEIKEGLKEGETVCLTIPQEFQL